MKTNLQLSLKQTSINYKTVAVGFALALSTVFLAMPQAQAAKDRWLKLQPDASSTEYMMLDRESIKADQKTPNLKNASAYINNPSPKPEEPQSARIDLRINCSEKTISIVKTAFFSKPDLKGEKIEEQEIPENSNPMNLDLEMDKTLYQTVCK